MSYKRVSKKWLSLITSPHFTRHLRDASPLRNAILMQRRPLDKDPGEAYLVSLDNRNTPSPFRPHNSQKFRILQSCNGLLLCSIIIPNSFEHNLFVYNLSTNSLSYLPKHTLVYDLRDIYFEFGLTYDPLKSLHYKVVAFVIRRKSLDNFYIYSSETETWKASIQSFIRAPGLIILGGVYWNGYIHWLSLSDCFYLDVDNERVETFPRPPTFERRLCRWRIFYFGESEDHLHVIDNHLYDTSLSVYEMKSDYSEWFVKYQIEVNPISQVFPEVTAVLSLIRREKFQEDTFLVLEILGGKVIRYNLVDKSFKLIWDFGVTLNKNSSEYGLHADWKVSSLLLQ